MESVPVLLLQFATQTNTSDIDTTFKYVYQSFKLYGPKTNVFLVYDSPIPMCDLKMEAPLVSQWKHCRLKHDKRGFFYIATRKNKNKNKNKNKTYKQTNKQTNKQTSNNTNKQTKQKQTNTPTLQN
jgi:GTP-dependent phosphoenolpyruvate carboxykinase